MTDEKLIQTPIALSKEHRGHCAKFGNMAAYIRHLIKNDIIEKANKASFIKE